MSKFPSLCGTLQGILTGEKDDSIWCKKTLLNSEPQYKIANEWLPKVMTPMVGKARGKKKAGLTYGQMS